MKRLVLSVGVVLIGGGVFGRLCEFSRFAEAFAQGNAFASKAAIPVIEVVITSPDSHSEVSGTVTFTASAPGAAMVDYWIAGHSIVIGDLPTTAPFTAKVDTKPLWDGPVHVVAVARDSGGAIRGQSRPVLLNVANGRATQIKHVSPDFSKPLKGTISWTVSASDAREIQAFIFFVDGKQVQLAYSSGVSATDTFELDTTKLANGTHAFYVQAVPKIKYVDSAQASFVGTVENAVHPLELRSNFRDGFLQPGQTLRLNARLILNDGSEKPAKAEFSSDKPAVARVSSTGKVTAVAQGVANIKLADGGKLTTARIVVSSEPGFPHFTTGGKIESHYKPGESLWVRTLFLTGGLQLRDNPAIAPAMRAAGVNAISSNFYYNPADNPTAFTDLDKWKKAAGTALQESLDAIKKEGFSMIGIGDDVQRTAGERENTLNNPWALDALKYTFSLMAKSGNVVSLEMQDEVGGTPVSGEFREVMAILNAAGPRPPLTWPPAGLQGPNVYAAWMGDSTMSDYTSFYWTYSKPWRLAYPWGAGLCQTKTELDNVIVDRFPVIQMSKPKYMLVSCCGPGYRKRVAGGDYQPGKDELQASGIIPDGISAQILYAAARGMSGVRVYAFDGVPGKTDSLWNDQRAQAAIDQGGLQTGATPFGNNPSAKDRWAAISVAFLFIKKYEPFFLSPQINAIDLGPDITTGARQGGDGRLLMAINMSDTVKSAHVDLSPYRYAGATPILRCHLIGRLSTSETVPNHSENNVTLAPGESIIWIFRP